MSEQRNVPGVRDYHHPAGGWGALKATAKAVKEQMGVDRRADHAVPHQQAGRLRLPGLRLAG